MKINISTAVTEFIIMAIITSTAAAATVAVAVV
jgi:hypothetical protein